MSGPYLSVGRIERRLRTGNVEALTFQPGVNLLVGPPNTGKTKWLTTLDYLMGDPDPVETKFDDHLVEKYDAASAELIVGEERLLVERRWKEAGIKTKVFVNGEGMAAKDFQHLLLEKLKIPLLHFPRGNPMLGQTWPELSWRMLLRHVYRQQRFWSGIADQQLDGEQHACLLHFLGLAERIFTDEYGRLIELRLKVERMKARREQYGMTLDALGHELLSVGDQRLSVTAHTVKLAEDRLASELEDLRTKRAELISRARDKAVSDASRGRIAELSLERAAIIVKREGHDRRASSTVERVAEMKRYRSELADELERLARAGDASDVLADLRITHCPACDQPVASPTSSDRNCHLCQRPLPDEPLMRELGVARLKFEADRLKGELQEADGLIDVLDREYMRLRAELTAADERLRMIENELSPARQAVSALVREELSAIDMAMGELSERQRQVSRLKSALELGDQLTDEIEKLEREIEPLENRVNQRSRAIDFDKSGELLANGMNDYLSTIHTLEEHVWRHGNVNVDLTRTRFNIEVGSRRYSTALGGTDTLYFLMSYHYGLMNLSDKEGCHYPGLSIIDLQGDFLGESIEDKENFIVQPFIDLLKKDSFADAQVIITGASFLGLDGVHRVRLSEVFAAR